MEHFDTKPPLQLIGEDGNALAVLGLARKAARDAGIDPARITAYCDDAMSGDYDHLLAVTQENFEVE